MAYQGKHILAKGALDFNKQLKDFLLECGWEHDEYSPTDTEPHRIAQEDKDAFILGWFLRSTGEDGKKDIPIHIGWQTRANTSRGYKGTTTYLTENPLSDSDVAISVKGITGFSNNDVIQIEDEFIKIGSPSGGAFPSCTRGYWGSTATSHAYGCVVARVTGSTPGITVYGSRDLNPAHAILSSDTGVSPDWNFTDTTHSGNIKMLDSDGIVAARDVFVQPSPMVPYYPNGKFDHSCLVRLSNGKMRWVTNQTCGGGDNYLTITFDELQAVPSPANLQCTFLSAGWFPSVSRRMPQSTSPSTTYSFLHSPCMYASFTSNSNKLVDQPRDCWVYASKDGIAVVAKYGYNTTGLYSFHYWGAYTPAGSSVYTTTTASVARAATTIVVDDPTLFKEGCMYKIFSQSYLDWKNNRDQLTNTYMSCPKSGGTGSWQNLDGDETAFEHIVVSSIDEETKTLTIDTGTCYSYQAGAVIGEDPRPHVGYGHQHNDAVGSSAPANYVQFGATVGDYSYGMSNGCIFHSVRQLERDHLPAHRIRWRCVTSSGAKFAPFGATTAWYPNLQNNNFCFEGGSWPLFDPAWSTSSRIDNSKPVIYPYQIMGVYKASGSHYSEYQHGADSGRYYGSIPMVFCAGITDQTNPNSPWGTAISEDQVKMVWQGNLETFRLFRLVSESGTSGITFLAFGPEKVGLLPPS